ncbi:MAG: Smr/MutS family protein, partial [Acidobacteriota bacterium]|nr:Smr/MutS family protein [Acidobacteriota bacterium]
LRMVRECLEMLESGQPLRFHRVVDLEPIFGRLGVLGAVLDPAEILKVLDLAEVAGAGRKALEAAGRQFPVLSGLARSQVGDLSGLISQLAGKIGPTGELEDGASPRLRTLRRQVAGLRSRICRSLVNLLRGGETTGSLQDEVVTVRNERFVVPVRTDRKRAFPGVVHGSSSSGSTLFIEPLQSVELNNRLIQLKEQVAAEVLRVLRALTEAIRQHLQELQAAARFVGVLDFSFAKARFCRKFQCVFPELEAGPVLEIERGRHPLLEMHLKEQGREIVPVSVNLGERSQVLVISGPNAGGKTVALKTVGMLTLMALSGIPVPAAAARIGLFRQIFADIGDRQSMTDDLSTFSAHLGKIRSILEEARPPALVLLDELGTGTDPGEGAALGTAILEELRSRGILTVVTTHLNGLKRYAFQTERVANASVEFEQADLRPTYRLIQGIPGNSSGIDMASQLGLPEPLVARARGLVSESEREVAGYARALGRQLTEATRLRNQLETERAALKDRRAQLENKQRELEESRSREIARCRKQAHQRFEKETSQLLAGIRDRFEEARLRSEVRRRARELKEVPVNGSRPADGGGPGLPEREKAPGEEIRAGVRVRVARLGSIGTITGPRAEGSWEVEVGALKCVLKGEELEPLGLDSGPPPPVRGGSRGVSVRFESEELASNEINLVGCTADEAIRRTDKFLDSALLASLSPVRLIHGSGMGVLRRAISEWLSDQSHVSEFHPAASDEGGNGVTVVSLHV